MRKPDPAGDLLASMETEFKKCLPEVLPWEMFARVALTGFRKTPDLLACNRHSLLGALMECARLGLAPCTPQASLIPFTNQETGDMTCQLVVGYQGYVALMYRSGQVEQVQAELVYEADEWEYTIGDGGRFWHRPKITLPREERGEPLFAYSFASLVTGGRTRVAIVNREDAVELQRRFGYKSTSPWRTNFHAMWLKSPVRRIQKWAPQSPEMRRLLAVDEAVVDTGGKIAESEEVLTASSDTPADVEPDQAGDVPRGEQGS